MCVIIWFLIWLIGFSIKKNSPNFRFCQFCFWLSSLSLWQQQQWNKKKISSSSKTHQGKKWPIQMTSWFSFCYSLIFVCSLTNLTSCLFDLTLFHHHHHYQLLIKKKTPNDRPTYQLQLWYVVVVSCLDKGLQKEKKREKKIRIFCCCSGKTVR